MVRRHAATGLDGGVVIPDLSLFTALRLRRQEHIKSELIEKKCWMNDSNESVLKWILKIRRLRRWLAAMACVEADTSC